MRVASVLYLNVESINWCLRNKIETIVYAKYSSDLNLDIYSNKIKFIYAYTDLGNILNYAYSTLQSKMPCLRKYFSYKNIEFEDAIVKDLYWSLLDNFAIDYSLLEHKLNYNSVLKYSARSNFKLITSILYKVIISKFKFSNINIDKNLTNNNLIFFRINVSAAIEIYGDLFKSFSKEQIASYQTTNSSIELIEKCNNFFIKNIDSSFKKNKYQTISFFDFIKLYFTYKDLYFLNAFISSIAKQKSLIDNYEVLFSSGVNKVVLNAGENDAEGIIAGLVAKKYNSKVFNYMNGYKAKDPHNIKTEFYCWFMPDEKTKELIESYCEVKNTKLPVVGHLIEEQAIKHKYHGTLDFIKSKLEGKQIISLFGSKFFDAEKSEVLAFLNDFTKRYESIVVLIRKHPAEKNNFSFDSENLVVLPQYLPELSQISLYDLFLKSNLTISFSSTVSMQAKWFGLPSINFDFNNEHRLAYIDNKTIFHVSEIAQLEKLINDFLIIKSKTVISTKRAELKTSELIKEYLIND